MKMTAMTPQMIYNCISYIMHIYMIMIICFCFQQQTGTLVGSKITHANKHNSLWQTYPKVQERFSSNRVYYWGLPQMMMWYLPSRHLLCLFPHGGMQEQSFKRFVQHERITLLRTPMNLQLTIAVSNHHIYESTCFGHGSDLSANVMNLVWRAWNAK